MSTFATEFSCVESGSEFSRRLTLGRPELAVEIGEIAITNLVSDKRYGPFGAKKQRTSIPDAQLCHILGGRHPCLLSKKTM